LNSVTLTVWQTFTADGVYDDYFFGASKPGSAGIGETVEHFYAGGANYRWEFFSPLASVGLGYAGCRFSYNSTLPEANARPRSFRWYEPVRPRSGADQTLQ